MTVHEILVDHPPACKLVVLALVDDVLTRKHIAERVGLTVDGVGRAVRRLEDEGVITTEGEQLHGDVHQRFADAFTAQE